MLHWVTLNCKQRKKNSHFKPEREMLLNVHDTSTEGNQYKEGQGGISVSNYGTVSMIQKLRHFNPCNGLAFNMRHRIRFS